MRDKDIVELPFDAAGQDLHGEESWGFSFDPRKYDRKKFFAYLH